MTNYHRTKEDIVAILLVGIVVFIIASLSSCRPAYSEPITEAIAVRCIIGEAENQGYEGMLQLAYALQNRGTTRGVYGYKAIVYRQNAYYRGDRRISKETASEALKAFKTAKLTQKYNLIGKSAHWENIKAFGTPSWAIGRTPKAIIKDHAFYEGIK